MKLSLDWHQSVGIGSKDYEVDFDVIPKTAGVYLFVRSHGANSEALYVGKALSLRSRIKQQFNNKKLMDGIKAAPNGARMLVYGEFVAKPGQQKSKSIEICEKALIRYYLAQGHNLLNIQGAKLQFHEIDSVRRDLKGLIPLSTKMLIK